MFMQLKQEQAMQMAVPPDTYTKHRWKQLKNCIYENNITQKIHTEKQVIFFTD